MASDSDTGDHLSELNTRWSILGQAHTHVDDVARQARFELIQRYGGAAYHYLCAACGDADVALDLAQEFGLRVLRGDLRGANPDRGRFRDYVKAILLHMVADHFRERRRQPGPLPDDQSVESMSASDDDRTFIELWRGELLNRTWDALRDDDRRQPHYEVLRWRVDHPEASADDASAALGRELGRPLTAANFRQMLHRARERFAELLVREVERSLGTAAPDAVRAELAELELLSYCGPIVG